MCSVVAGPNSRIRGFCGCCKREPNWRKRENKMEEGLSRAGTWTWHPDDVVKAHKMPTGAKKLPKCSTRLTFTTNLPPIAPEKRLRLLLEQDDKLSRTTSWRTSAEHGKNGRRAAKSTRRAPKFGTWTSKVHTLTVRPLFGVWAAKCLHDGGGHRMAGDVDFTQRTSKINPRRTMSDVPSLAGGMSVFAVSVAVDATSLSSCCVERVHSVSEQEFPVGIAVVVIHGALKVP